MSNQSNLTGNENIVIQGVSDSTITLNVNGETKEIRNELAELKVLMEQLSIQSFSWAKQVYQIGDLNDANFGFVTEKKAFNEGLTKCLIEALQPHSKLACRFLEKANNASADWVSQPRISDTAKDIIAQSFVGVMGIQLRKLMAIGKEDLSSVKQRKYIENCHATVRRALQLISFSLLAKMWDYQKEKKIDLNEEQQKVVHGFFEGEFERNVIEQISLLRSLLTYFQSNNLAFPLTEISDFNENLQDGSDFYNACMKIQDIKSALDKSDFNMLTCLEAEKQMMVILVSLSFLAAYKMISIKSITYNETRNDPPRYLHKFSALGIDRKRNLNAEKIRFDANPAITDGILLYKGQYSESTNLFPFVIDYNSLIGEVGSRICFFNSRDISDGSLNYVFLEDNTIENIVYKNTLKDGDGDRICEIMMNKDDRAALKLDTVYLHFIAAKKAILGGLVEDDFSDLFEEEEDKF